jgi:TP901 family phage tail tape measure protein
MSRAGFGEAESEKLAELSILAQSAGDMTAEMANEYIIATNAAYSLAGNSEKLNKVLDSQNYITNHNAVSMENLAQATKLAASQAAASGVEIDELTAAVGTMVAVTQQGGDQAGRAFKGILMNIQQVKASAADIGDGGEDITAESLSKYEKATAALGVSLKEVKNGTVQLRKPMEVLRDLAIAVNKEGENSVKVANLISAVGGKFRGNQLIALLQNWETYEKMLSEYNSDDAIDSAFKESQKSANNWAGSINKVKNSWTEFVNVFINSDNMKEMLNTINEIIQNLTDSAVSGGLKITFDLLNKILKVIEFLTEQLGTLGTVALPLIMKFTTLHKLDLWSSIKSQLTATIPVIQATTLEYEKLYQAELLAADTRNYFTSNANGASMLTGAVATPFTSSAGVDYSKAINDVQTYSTKYSVAVSSMEKSSKSASSAVGGLVTALRNFAIIAVVTFAIKKASEYIDSYNIDAEESARKTSEVVAELTELKSALDNLKEEKDTLNNILQSYGEVVSKTQSTAEKKEALAKIQKDLNDLYGTEAKGIDVVNGKYDDQIKKIDKLQKDKEEKFKKEHAADIAQAQAMSSLYMGEEDFTLYTDGYDFKKGDYKYSYDTVKRINEDSLEAIYVLDQLDQAAVKAAKDIEGIYYGSYTGFKSGNNHRCILVVT